MTINGSYTQTAVGSLNVAIGGVTAGSQFDQLNISGPAALDGTLNASLVNGFSPTIGDAFKMMAFASRNGQFAAITGSANRLRANYSATDLTLVSESQGIKVNPTFGLATSEAGTTATFAVVLDSPPTADVSIALASDNLAEGTTSPATLLFNARNLERAADGDGHGRTTMWTMATWPTTSFCSLPSRPIRRMAASIRAMSR